MKFIETLTFVADFYLFLLFRQINGFCVDNIKIVKVKNIDYKTKAKN